MHRLMVGPLLCLLAGCGLKNLAAGALCNKAVLAAVAPAAPVATDCRRDAVCDVRVFDPSGEDSNGVAFPSSLTLGDTSVSLQIFRYNTFTAMKDAADSSEYDRTEVVCYFPSSHQRAEKSGQDSNKVLADAVSEVRAKCLSGAKP